MHKVLKVISLMVLIVFFITTTIQIYGSSETFTNINNKQNLIYNYGDLVLC